MKMYDMEKETITENHIFDSDLTRFIVELI